VSERVRSSIWLRLALRAYPHRWRRAHEIELIDVLRDSVPPQRNWPGWRALADLVVGGWRIRWRMRPPLRRWVGYRFFDVRLPQPWREWARADIDGAWWPVRSVGVGVAISTAVWLVLFALRLPTPYLISPFAGVLTSVFGVRRHRRGAWRRHVTGRPVADSGAWQRGWIPAPARLRVAPILAIAGAALVSGGLFAAWALLNPSSDQARLGHVVGFIWLALAIGVAVLVITGVAAHRRVSPRLATRQADERPPRRLQPVALAGLAAAQTAIEAAGGVAQRADAIPGIFSLMLTAGIAIGPALIVLAVVALRSERRLGLDVTGRDLRLAVFGANNAIPPEPARSVIAVIPARIGRRSAAGGT
jgi:heme exporter protein D